MEKIPELQGVGTGTFGVPNVSSGFKIILVWSDYEIRQAGRETAQI